ncbi:MAG: hypothetical protein KC776_17820 [Myxococcales bacterium]|nr:hypothetical protein [Myxococcales bacterium]MCB9579605.1 hypothetical protein [Polyangiaceae bacterium]
MASRALLLAVALGLAGCSGGPAKFPLKDAMWVDPDRHPFEDKPEEYYSPFAWDGADQLVFRPISRFFAVDPAGAAVNVNAWDEVADSSWFSNRIGRYGMSPEQVARGPCVAPMPSTTEPWTVTGAKPNGANPGFLIKGPDDNRYLVKFDGVVQGSRASAADVIGSRIYHAAGYFVPCNRIVYFKRDILRYAPDAKAENDEGEKEPLSDKHLDKVFKMALRLPDGRYRANLSLFVEGKPIGPWTYQGTRGDDPNDVIPHEDRRELRGMEVLAAWVNHFDSREQNTLATFIADGGRGYVRHNVIDFGDCFGSIWEPPMLGRRIGHAYYLDFPYVLEDLVTLGTIERPWDTARFGASGPVFGYFDVKSFDPNVYRPGYPNPAFVRKRERDAAWMARIMARFSDAHVRSMVEAGQMEPGLTAELTRILIGRRDKILRRYLTRLSPLSWPKVRVRQGKAELCVEDLAVLSHVADASARGYSSRAWLSESLTPATVAQPTKERGRFACVALPAVKGASKQHPEYLVLDISARSRDHAPGPLRVHLYHLGGNDYRIAGIERPADHDAPG